MRTKQIKIDENQTVNENNNNTLTNFELATLQKVVAERDDYKERTAKMTSLYTTAMNDLEYCKQCRNTDKYILWGFIAFMAYPIIQTIMMLFK